MSEKDILLLGYAREGSTRIKDKMNRKFGDTTLFDIYMKKFEDVKKMHHPFSNIKMALGQREYKLWNSAKNYDVDILERSDYSISASVSDDCKQVYHYLEDIKEDYVMWVNGCFPFLTLASIIQIGKFFKKSDIKGLHCVKKKYTWIWDNNTRTIMNSENIGKISTVHFEPFLESVHCCHIYNKRNLLDNNSYWSFKKGDPYLYEVDDSTEFMDIDVESEFKVAEELYKSNVMEVVSRIKKIIS